MILSRALLNSGTQLYRYRSCGFLNCGSSFSLFIAFFVTSVSSIEIYLAVLIHMLIVMCGMVYVFSM